VQIEESVVLGYNLTRAMNIMGPGRLIAAMQT